MEVSRHELKLHDPEVFGPGAEELCGRFLRRIFSVEQVQSVAIDRARSTATVSYDRDGHTVAELLSMAAAIRGSGPGGAEGGQPAHFLPADLARARLTVYRYKRMLTTWQVSWTGPAGSACGTKP